MKISLSGRYSVSEFETAIEKVVHTLAENGVSHLGPVTLYLHLYKGRRRIEFHDPENPSKALRELQYDGPLAKGLQLPEEISAASDAVDAALNLPNKD